MPVVRSARVLRTPVLRPEHPATGLTPFFFDDFSSPTLDDTKWWASGRPYKTGPDWMDSSYAGDDCRFLDSNVTIEDSRLVLACRNVPNVRAGVTKGFSGGMVTTAGLLAGAPDSFRQRFAPPVRLDVSAKIPSGRGLWPVIWFMPVRNGWPPEIDVAEFLCQDPSKNYTTFHYDDGGHRQINWRTSSFGDLSQAFHVYSVEWREESIKWFIDYAKVFETTSSFIPTEEMYLMLTCMVGHATTYPGPPDENTPFPSYFTVDWVRASTISA